MLPHKFNIRVYALVIKDQKVLLVKERIDGFEFTKFPGGGVELGEGLLTALYREIKEELATECTSATHFYTTDFFQASAFNRLEQIISIYYKVGLVQNPIDGKITEELDHTMQFYWKPLEELQEEDVTFPIDKHVVGLLMKA
jgi:8-oxo-dGTP diphosphatase